MCHVVDEFESTSHEPRLLAMIDDRSIAVFACIFGITESPESHKLSIQTTDHDRIHMPYKLN
jgi:hypothetical protein